MATYSVERHGVRGTINLPDPRAPFPSATAAAPPEDTRPGSPGAQ